MPPTAVRLLLIVAALTTLAGGCRRDPAAEDPATVLRRAVARTLSSGSVRFHGRVSPTGGATMILSGVTSLKDDAAHVTAAVEATPPLPAVPPAEVRVTNGGAWVLAPGSSEWVAVDPEIARASPATSWRELLDLVASSTSVTRDGDGRLRGRLLDGTVVAELDGTGRVRTLRLGLRGSFDLEFSDFGVDVKVAPPP